MASKIIVFPPSTVDQLSQDNFLGPIVDGVHGAHPLHLVGSFQGFSDALLLHHGFFNDFQPLPAGGVDFLQVGKQLFGDNEIGIQNGSVFF